MSYYNLDSFIKNNTIILEELPKDFWEDSKKSQYTLDYYLKYVVVANNPIKVQLSSPVVLKNGNDKIYKYWNEILSNSSSSFIFYTLALSVVWNNNDDTFDISIEYNRNGDEVKVLHRVKYTFNSLKYHIPIFLSIN